MQDMRPGRWSLNWWPLARLLIVLAALNYQAYLMFDWTIPWRALPALPGKLLTTFLGLAFMSYTLAYFYALFLLLPLALFCKAEEFLYAAAIRWILRGSLGLPDGRLLKVLALSGELAPFVAGFYYLSQHLPYF